MVPFLTKRSRTRLGTLKNLFETFNANPEKGERWNGRGEVVRRRSELTRLYPRLEEFFPAKTKQSQLGRWERQDGNGGFGRGRGTSQPESIPGSGRS